MNRFIHILAFFPIVGLIFLPACMSTPSDQYDSFGAVITPEASGSTEVLIAELAKADTVNVKLIATIDEVCQAKGCWMTLKGDQKVRVTFKDYAFFVPKDASGREVVVEGVAIANALSEDEARHFAEDAGKPFDPSMMKEISIVANGVLIKKADQL